MKMIVGLGNPGKEYEQTRHNMGFQVLDRLANNLEVEFRRIDFQGLYVKTVVDDEDVLFIKPQTYMNLSGDCVAAFAHFYKIDPEDILIVYDDMDLPAGKVRMREEGSSGGQRGMKHILEKMGTMSIPRLRIGIGKPIHDVVDYVLSKPSQEDAIAIAKAQEDAVHRIRDFIRFDLHHAISKAKQ